MDIDVLKKIKYIEDVHSKLGNFLKNLRQYAEDNNEDATKYVIDHSNDVLKTLIESWHLLYATVHQTNDFTFDTQLFTGNGSHSGRWIHQTHKMLDECFSLLSAIQQSDFGPDDPRESYLEELHDKAKKIYLALTGEKLKPLKKINK